MWCHVIVLDMDGVLVVPYTDPELFFPAARATPLPSLAAARFD